ncbi:class II glutamine amidotransferase [Candidatus Bathyarchaeota archaeon]|nr:class II glutamine amidotransferase [Candidatus Bathyarchaeota archaeon]
MCRLLGILSLNPSVVGGYLLSDPCSLYVQSRVNPARLQSDGWGLGFYESGMLRLVKSERPVYEEFEFFKSVVESLRSNIIVAHIRRASNPRGLPRSMLISVENSQPFGYGNYVFAHNGVIMLPDEMASLLGDWRNKIRGLNDSEVYFWHIIKGIFEGKSLKEALIEFQETLHKVWLENHRKYLDRDRPYIGLNMIFSDGNKLYAYCKYDEERDGRTKSLCYGDQPAMQMVYVTSANKLIVASEKTNAEETWLPIRSGQLLVGEVVGGRVKVSMEEV